MENIPNILRTRDVAVLLDMSPDAVNDLARKGVLKGYKSGNQWRFRRKDIERYLDREGKKLAPPGGLEHPANGLGNRCSIRLSYGGASQESPPASPLLLALEP